MNRPIGRRQLARLSALAAAALTIRPPEQAAARATGASESPPLAEFIMSRWAWAAPPADAGMRPHTVARVTIHHTGPPAWHGVPAAAGLLRAIHAFHTGPERRWPDIAYHLLIDLDGVIWEGRPLAVAGDTATAYDPTGHALIALLGDYDGQTPNDAQVAQLSRTIRWLNETYGLDPATLGGHRDYAATACPGRHLAALIDALRS